MAKQTQLTARRWYNDNFDQHADPYKEVRHIQLNKASTKGNRDGFNDRSGIGPERLQVLWKDREDVLNRVTRYATARFPDNPQREIDRWMDGFDNDVIYTIWRSGKSNVSPKMVERYKSKGVKYAPGNNGRIRAGQMCAILAFMDSWVVPATREKLIKEDHDGTTKADLIKAGSWLLGTEKNFKNSIKSKRVTNINKQHTRTSILMINGNTIVDSIDDLNETRRSS